VRQQAHRARPGPRELALQTDRAGDVPATTDANGQYRLEKLAPGAIKVFFHTADGREQWAYQKLSYDEAESFTLSLGTVTTVNDTLLPLTTLAGQSH
jgi:hypothetical protein